jgi:hypothetical protein
LPDGFGRESALDKKFRQNNIDEALAIKALVTQAERLYPLSKRLDAKIEELEKYLETHNEHVTRIVLETLKQIRGKNA